MALQIESESAAVGRTLRDLAGTPETPLALAYVKSRIILTREGEAPQHFACPVHPKELMRALAQSPSLPAMGSGWQFDATARTLSRNGDSHTITEKEALLLSLLLKSYPTPVSREALLKEGWGLGDGVETHTLETHIYRLRNKLSELDPRPCDIVTADNAYKLEMAA